MFCAFCVAEQHLDDVKKELGYFAHWKNLGLNLGLSPSSLEEIDVDYMRVNEKLEAVLLRWLRKEYNLGRYGPPTWKQLAEAVRTINIALAVSIMERRL